MESIKRPDLTDSKIISFDIETYDPNIKKKGPGVYRRDGYILGVGIANNKGFSEYYNINHPTKGSFTDEDKKKNIRYLKDCLKTDIAKLATNALYDLDWLCNRYNFKINGKINDIQIAEPLLNEYKKSYSLHSLGNDYFGIGKETNEIDNFCELNKLKGDSRAHLYLMNYELVRKYGKADVILPLKIFKEQQKKLIEEDLWELYNLEVALYPLLLKMRKIGVKIDSEKLEEAKFALESDIKVSKEKLYNNYGNFNYNSSKQIAEIFDKLNIKYPFTEKGNPSLNKEFLESCDNNIAIDILNIKHKEKILSTFLINSLTDHRIKERIHCSFFPLRNDSYGTKSGRFSSANPNLQQIPSKDDPASKLCRKLFIPEENCNWVKADYSQIEYRIIAHYASGSKSDLIREQYNNNPDTDYHKLIMDWTALNRKSAKNLNFGMAYAMGVATCAKKFKWPKDEAKEKIDRYNKMVPFVKETRINVGNVARGRGYIRTILNRKARMSPEMKKLGKEYTMFNRLIQGSAADIMKKAMLECYKAGIFNVLHPHLTVHDEIDCSVPKTREGLEAVKEMKYIMENAVKLKVPIIADIEMGDNWGECDENKYKKLLDEYKV